MNERMRKKRREKKKMMLIKMLLKLIQEEETMRFCNTMFNNNALVLYFLYNSYKLDS